MAISFLEKLGGGRDKQGEVSPNPNTGPTVLGVLGELSDAEDISHRGERSKGKRRQLPFLRTIWQFPFVQPCRVWVSWKQQS